MVSYSLESQVVLQILIQKGKDVAMLTTLVNNPLKKKRNEL